MVRCKVAIGCRGGKASTRQDHRLYSRQPVRLSLAETVVGGQREASVLFSVGMRPVVVVTAACVVWSFSALYAVGIRSAFAVGRASASVEIYLMTVSALGRASVSAGMHLVVKVSPSSVGRASPKDAMRVMQLGVGVQVSIHMVERDQEFPDAYARTRDSCSDVDCTSAVY